MRLLLVKMPRPLPKKELPKKEALPAALVRQRPPPVPCGSVCEDLEDEETLDYYDDEDLWREYAAQRRNRRNQRPSSNNTGTGTDVGTMTTHKLDTSTNSGTDSGTTANTELTDDGTADGSTSTMLNPRTGTDANRDEEELLTMDDLLLEPA